MTFDGFLYVVFFVLIGAMMLAVHLYTVWPLLIWLLIAGFFGGGAFLLGLHLSLREFLPPRLPNEIKNDYDSEGE